jgi:hypothetical protein
MENGDPIRGEGYKIVNRRNFFARNDLNVLAITTLDQFEEGGLMAFRNDIGLSC